MQQRAGNLDLPHLPAREVAYLVMRALRQRDTLQQLIGAGACLPLADAVQGGVIDQILNDGEIEIEGARLKHHADRTQGLARRAHDVMTENPDVAALNGIETRNQRKKRALSGAVESQQNGESGWRDRESHVDQRRTRPITMAHTLDRKRGRQLWVLDRHAERRYCREIATPQGSSPTWIVLMTLRLATSMTETSFDTPLVVKRYFSSGVKAMCQTRCPTRRYFSTACVAAFITAT